MRKIIPALIGLGGAYGNDSGSLNFVSSCSICHWFSYRIIFQSVWNNREVQARQSLQGFIQMKTLYVYENARLRREGLNSIRETMIGAETQRNKIEYAGNTFYFVSMDNFDHARGLLYNSWYKMGDFDLQTWQRDTLDAHCRGEL